LTITDPAYLRSVAVVEAQQRLDLQLREAQLHPGAKVEPGRGGRGIGVGVVHEDAPHVHTSTAASIQDHGT